MKRRLRIFTLACGLISSNQPCAGGMPVFDAANFEQAMQQVASWSQQYQQMAQQIQQMQQQIANVTGGRGMSDLLNSPAYQQARRTLPPDAQQVLGLANGGSYGNLGNSINTIKQTISTLNRDSFQSSTTADQWRADINRSATSKALSMAAYTAAAQRLQNLEDLTSQISQTQDPKAIEELQGRIATEQAMIQNEQARIQALSMLIAAEKDIAEQQAHEISIKTAGSIDRIPRTQIDP